MKHNEMKCSRCRSTGIYIYIRMSYKLCIQCWQAEKLFNKEFIKRMKQVPDKEPPLGYKFVMDSWFTDKAKGKKFAAYAFDNLGSWFSVC